MLLWVVFAAVSAVVVLAVVSPLMRRAEGAAARAPELEVFRDQLKEIDDELGRGVIGEDDAEAARIEVSRRLIAAAERREAKADAAGGGRNLLRRGALAAAMVGIPALSLSLYLLLGSPHLPGQPHARRVQTEIEKETVAGLLGRIEAHLRENPDDARGWQVIAPIYVRLGRYADAADAYRRLLAFSNRNARVLADYGEVLVLSRQGLVGADARKVFAEAREKDPALAKPDFYLGLAEQQDGKLRAAVARWKKLLARAPQEAPWREALNRHLRAAERRLAAQDADPAAPALSDEQMAAARQMSAPQRRQMIEGMVERLARRLEQDGADLAGWLRLARAHSVLGRPDEARLALSRARENFAEDEAALARIEALRQSLGLKDGEGN